MRVNPNLFLCDPPLSPPGIILGERAEGIACWDRVARQGTLAAEQLPGNRAPR